MIPGGNSDSKRLPTASSHLRAPSAVFAGLLELHGWFVFSTKLPAFNEPGFKGLLREK